MKRHRPLYALGLLALVALLAPLLASDLPLAARVDGKLYVVPCLTRPAALLDDDNQTLARRADWIVATPIPYGPLASRPGGVQQALARPSSAHWLGTDDRGRDVMARLVHGSRTALVVGPVAVGLALLLGLALGLASGLAPRLDLLLGRVIEVGETFPVFFLLLALQGALSAPSLVEVAAAIALARWPTIARLVRAEALRAAALPHVEAARAVGAGPLRVALRHVLPLAVAPALTAAALGVPQAVLLETGLTFLGCGVPPPTPSWGELLAQAQSSGLLPHLLLAPALALAFTTLACQQAADHLRRR